MQAIPMSKSRDKGPLTSSPAYLDVAPATRGRAPQRCQRCGIPLGPSRCPNLVCDEMHGERAGTLCVWCYETQQARQSNKEFPQ